ncbi:prepilin-type N-terminal cleavage/methylation domain-containing protein [Enterococcus sp. CWB-B31]|uniref:prepilin-type N-terminal cleavage/methylation domain-containing protein n=1 Tax=Enterococcus sp. CWB-B31 TaxID=2885159 RepID=UPI001E3C892C|nr:prepilin-type N-terminal cleavage/methylation domain-containing protein [Enterococcus sp. CWB-B31]MCB5953427.1 prepilin-type N-terminal cleavage/methylation domain-containing protein [Enterococcus sp. CWB-B31]
MIEALTFQEESRMSRLLKDERGMTLIELLATVVILAIIAGIGVVAIGNVIQNSREDAAVADVQQALNAAKLYQASPTKAFVPTSTSLGDFSLQEVIDAKMLEGTSKWADPDKVNFVIDTEGTLTVYIPAGQLTAGSKTSQEIGTTTVGVDTQEINNLRRDNLF